MNHFSRCGGLLNEDELNDFLGLVCFCAKRLIWGNWLGVLSGLLTGAILWFFFSNFKSTGRGVVTKNPDDGLKLIRISPPRRCHAERGTAPCFLGEYNRIFSPFSSHLPCGLLLTEWPVSETTSRACWVQGMEGQSASGTAMALPCLQVVYLQPSSRPKRSVPAPWPCTTLFRSGRTASPSTGRSSSSARTTWSGSTPRKSLSGHILFSFTVKAHSSSICTDSCK